MNGLLKKWLKRIKLNESTISTILGALVIIVVGALIINYFRGVNQPSEVAQEAESEEVSLIEEEKGKFFPAALPTEHLVKAGENLWAIAEKHYGSGYNWVDIAKENNIKDPNYIQSGQNLKIPKTEVITPVVAEETAFGPAITGSNYTVKKNDHLWGIAVRAYGDGYQWEEIARENNLDNPDFIHPGNVLVLPR